MTIRALGVVIPAQNETTNIKASIESVVRAITWLALPVLVVVVDDRSTDGSGYRAHALLEGVQHSVLRQDIGTVGTARHAGVIEAARHFHHIAPDQLWIASTDADSQVPRDWLSRQVIHANAGADAVAGIVQLGPCSPALRRGFERAYALGMTRTSHRHIHGANLGFSYSAYRAAGGFRALACGEDNALWSDMRRTGAKLMSDPSLAVTTSARTVSRTSDGFASVLSRIATPSLAADPSASGR